MARPTDKVRFALAHTVTTTATYSTIYTVPQDETTVYRILGKIAMAGLSETGASTYMRWAIMVNPSGTSLYTLTTTGTVDGRDAEQFLASGAFTCVTESGGTHAWHIEDLDTKAMRKLEKDDVLTLVTISNATSSFQIYFDGIAFFKV